MFSTSTAITAFGDVAKDVSSLLVYAVPVILGIAAALIGLGWAYRKFKKHASGRKF